MPTSVKIDTLRGSGEIVVHNFNSSEVLVHRTIITQDNALKLINELIVAIDVAKDVELLKYENELKSAKERKAKMELELSNISKTIEDLEAGSKMAFDNLKNFKSQVVNVPTDFAKKGELMPYKGYRTAKEKSKLGIEVWKDVPGYKSCYEVSNLGVIRSKNRTVIYSNGRKHFHAARILVQSQHKFGYKLVSLCNQGKQTTVSIHSIMLQTFHSPKSLELPHSRHLDGNPTNNKLYNLIWGTVVENQSDRRVHGTNVSTPGEKHPQAKLTDKKVLEIRKLSSNGIKGNTLAVRYNVSITTISEIINRKIWRHL